jgi:hypothetical protein
LLALSFEEFTLSPEVLALFTLLALSLEGSFEGSLDPRSRSCREVPIKIRAGPPALAIFQFHFSIFQFPLSFLDLWPFARLSREESTFAKVYQNKHFNFL